MVLIHVLYILIGDSLSKFCDKCGAEIKNENSKYCDKCGNEVNPTTKENSNNTTFTCSNCGTKIINFKGNCPNCGKPLKNNDGVKALGVGLGIIALIIIVPVVIVILYVFLSILFSGG